MSKTFAFQDQLNTLPLSNLKDASKNFLDWVEPLLTIEQFNRTKQNLKNFMTQDGLILEKKLEEWSKQNNGNWLAPLWKDMYLDIRDPVVIDVNSDFSEMPSFFLFHGGILFIKRRNSAIGTPR